LYFAIPLMLTGLFTLVFGNQGPRDISIRVLLWDEDRTMLTQLLTGAGAQLEERGIDLIQVDDEGLSMMDNGEATALLHIPQGFSRSFLNAQPCTLELVKNPSQRFLPQAVEEGTRLGAVLLSAAARVFSDELAQLASLFAADSGPSDEAIASLSVSTNQTLRLVKRYALPPPIGLETVTLDDPTDSSQVNMVSYFFPGFSLMGVFFLAQAVSRDIVRERERGMLRHLLTAPVTTWDYLLGKCCSMVTLAALAFVLLMLFGAIVGVVWGSLTAMASLMLAPAVAVSGTMLLIISLVGSERQADALTTIVIMVWSMLGGAFMPLAAMPKFLLPISRSTLFYWAVDGLNQCVFAKAGVADIALNLTVLLGSGGVLLLLGSWRLSRRIHGGGV